MTLSAELHKELRLELKLMLGQDPGENFMFRGIKVKKQG